MVSMRFFAIGAGLTLAQVAIADSGLLPRAPFEAFGIVKETEEATTNEYAAKFAPHALLGEKNASLPLVKERSLELEERQTCNPGYGYCSGKCILGLLLAISDANSFLSLFLLSPRLTLSSFWEMLPEHGQLLPLRLLHRPRRHLLSRRPLPAKLGMLRAQLLPERRGLL